MSIGQIKALIALGEEPGRVRNSDGCSEQLPVFIIMDIALERDAPASPRAVLPSLGFAEKRGSMINGKGRLQRLNRALRGPGQARDDWEILRDLIQALSGGNGIYTIEDVFREMSGAVPEFAGLTLSRIGDLGVQVQISINHRDLRRAAQKRCAHATGETSAMSARFREA